MKNWGCVSLEGKEKHRTQKTHVEMLKKREFQGQGQSEKRLSHSGPWAKAPNSGHESLSALARQGPWSARWTCSSLWPGACWQWSCTVLFELLPDTGSVSSSSRNWDQKWTQQSSWEQSVWEAVKELLLMLSGLASLVYPLALLISPSGFWGPSLMIL